MSGVLTNDNHARKLGSGNSCCKLLKGNLRHGMNTSLNTRHQIADHHKSLPRS